MLGESRSSSLPLEAFAFPQNVYIKRRASGRVVVWAAMCISVESVESIESRSNDAERERLAQDEGLINREAGGTVRRLRRSGVCWSLGAAQPASPRTSIEEKKERTSKMDRERGWAKGIEFAG